VCAGKGIGVRLQPARPQLLQAWGGRGRQQFKGMPRLAAAAGAVASPPEQPQPGAR
jgi:hypothetical protein